MDFIHNLSQSFVNDLREKLHENTQDINMTDSNTAKDYGIYCEFISINNFILNNYKCKYSF